jgi:hypothetical protein
MYGNSLHRHLADVENLAAKGVAAPPEWLALRSRFDSFVLLGNSAADALASEVIAGTGADLSALRSMALAEASATSTDDAAVSDVVRSRVHGRLVELYQPVATRNFHACAEKFDSAAAAFTRCAKTVDPLSDPASLVNGSAAARTAWFSAPVLSSALDEALALLGAAARLAGAPDADDEAQIQIPLALLDVGKLHRRRVWEAWAATGRCGRWASVVSLATVRAERRPGKLVPYSAPKPLQQMFIRGVHGGYATKVIDPHDDSNTARNADEWSIA